MSDTIDLSSTLNKTTPEINIEGPNRLDSDTCFYVKLSMIITIRRTGKTTQGCI